MPKRLIRLLLSTLLVTACVSSLPALPRAPATGWRSYTEIAANVTIRLPATWRIIDAERPPSQAEIDRLTAAGDPLTNYLKTMKAAVESGTYVLQSIDPATVDATIPFGTSMFLAFVPGYGAERSPEVVLRDNLAATKDLYRLPSIPGARAVAPPKGFDHAWQVEYVWTATRVGSGSVELAGLHYLLVSGDDAWILGFTTMLERGRATLETWRQIGGSISAHSPAGPLNVILIVAVTIAAIGSILAVLVLIRLLRRRRSVAPKVRSRRRR